MGRTEFACLLSATSSNSPLAIFTSGSVVVFTHLSLFLSWFNSPTRHHGSGECPPCDLEAFSSCKRRCHILLFPHSTTVPQPSSKSLVGPQGVATHSLSTPIQYIILFSVGSHDLLRVVPRNLILSTKTYLWSDAESARKLMGFLPSVVLIHSLLILCFPGWNGACGLLWTGIIFVFSCFNIWESTYTTFSFYWPNSNIFDFSVLRFPVVRVQPNRIGSCFIQGGFFIFCYYFYYLYSVVRYMALWLHLPIFTH